jgi:hypothetical protein
MCFITTCHGQRPCWLKAEDLFKADGQISELRVLPLDLGHRHNHVAEAVTVRACPALASVDAVSSGGDLMRLGRPGAGPQCTTRHIDLSNPQGQVSG